MSADMREKATPSVDEKTVKYQMRDSILKATLHDIWQAAESRTHRVSLDQTMTFDQMYDIWDSSWGNTSDNIDRMLGR